MYKYETHLVNPASIHHLSLFAPQLLSPGNIMLIIIKCENLDKFAHPISAHQVEAPSDPAYNCHPERRIKGCIKRQVNC